MGERILREVLEKLFRMKLCERFNKNVGMLKHDFD